MREYVAEFLELRLRVAPKHCVEAFNMFAAERILNRTSLRSLIMSESTGKSRRKPSKAPDLERTAAVAVMPF